MIRNVDVIVYQPFLDLNNFLNLKYLFEKNVNLRIQINDFIYSNNHRLYL